MRPAKPPGGGAGWPRSRRSCRPPARPRLASGGCQHTKYLVALEVDGGSNQGSRDLQQADIIDVGILSGPGRPPNLFKKVGGARPPTFLDGFGTDPARLDPKNK